LVWILQPLSYIKLSHVQGKFKTEQKSTIKFKHATNSLFNSNLATYGGLDIWLICTKLQFHRVKIFSTKTNVSIRHSKDRTMFHPSDNCIEQVCLNSGEQFISCRTQTVCWSPMRYYEIIFPHKQHMLQLNIKNVWAQQLKQSHVMNTGNDAYITSYFQKMNLQKIMPLLEAPEHPLHLWPWHGFSHHFITSQVAQKCQVTHKPSCCSPLKFNITSSPPPYRKGTQFNLQ